MASRIVRKPNCIVLIGAPTSAAASGAGSENGPDRLRAAGLSDRLGEAGFDVKDLGNSHAFSFQTDNENPRARNLHNVLPSLESLRPLVEQAIKTGGLPLILGGDNSIALAVLGALRRHHRALSLFYVSRHAGLNVPATSSSGFIEDMIIAHVTGQGAAELVRFWGDPPPVREPEIALFGVDRRDTAAAEWLRRSPMRCYMAEDLGHEPPAEAAQLALERIHGHQHEFLLHLDASIVAQNNAAEGHNSESRGLGIGYVRGVLAYLCKQPYLAAIEVTSYNPGSDMDGRVAETLVTLLADALRARREDAGSAESAAEPASPGSSSVLESSPPPPSMKILPKDGMLAPDEPVAPAPSPQSEDSSSDDGETSSSTSA